MQGLEDDVAEDRRRSEHKVATGDDGRHFRLARIRAAHEALETSELTAVATHATRAVVDAASRQLVLKEELLCVRANLDERPRRNLQRRKA